MFKSVEYYYYLNKQYALKCVDYSEDPFNNEQIFKNSGYVRLKDKISLFILQNRNYSNMSDLGERIDKKDLQHVRNLPKEDIINNQNFKFLI